MIAIDASAFVAIAKDEFEGDVFEELIMSRRCLVSVPTLHEVHSVLRGYPDVDPLNFIDEFVGLPNISIIGLVRSHLDESRAAFDRYGRGRGHPAKLNFGDCMSYSVAKVAGIPLLFKGDDFSHTDITPAYFPA